MIIGTLLLFNFIRTVTPLFLIHQLTTLIAPFLVIEYAVREPYVEIGPLVIPVAVDGFSAFAMKNLVFLAAFMFLYASYMTRRDRTTSGGNTPVT